jgi:hypothetical protein
MARAHAVGDALLVAGMTIYTFAVRVHGIARHFLMLGDQIRDWSIALGPFSSLPLAGPPRVDGGYSWGPVFYWALWLIRVTIGPFVHNLPHAGGLGLAAAQSFGDGVLCFGIRKCSGSWAFAAGTTLIVATCPFDLALSSAIWNPVLAVAFAKTTTGLLLWWQDSLTAARRIVLLALAWLTVQAHTPALPFALAVFAWVVVRQARSGAREAAMCVTEAAVVLALLQFPYVMARVPDRPPTLPGLTAPAGVWSAIADPRTIHPARAYDALVSAFEQIVLRPWRFEHAGIVLAAAGTLLLFRLGPFAAPVAASVAPVAAAVAILSLWQYSYDSYWLLTLMPAAILTVVWTARTLPWRTARSFAAALLLIVAVLIQKPRIEEAASFFRLPEYGTLVQSSRDLVRRGEPLQHIEAPFLPPSADPEFVYRILGGQIKPDAAAVAVLSPSGEITYKR